MKRISVFFAILISLFQTILVFAQDTKIAIPEYNDKYSHYVKKLEGEILILIMWISGIVFWRVANIPKLEIMMN